jgi:hypothetical protein
METILLNLLTASLAEFSKINADLAATGRNLKATGAARDDITAQVRAREGHREFSMFTPDNGRA